MNYEEVVESLSKLASALHEDKFPKCASVCDSAIDTIETLSHKLDMAMSDIPKECRTCARWGAGKKNPICHDCWFNENRWEWRRLNE